ncbi:hypothetical protein MPN20_08410 [Brevibacterium sp. ZH18]|nr:hypothetical protein [Brevibacterium sp. ZH18]
MEGARFNSDDPVRSALHRLIDRGLTSDIELKSLVPEDIENSWRRSISSRVDPEGQPRIEDIGAKEELIRAASRVMDRWLASLSDTKTTLLLGDEQGRIVWRRTNDARVRRTLDVVGAVEGGDFSETSSGTNGLGTSIEARKPILVRGSQHFLETLRDVACSAAPVVHPLTGRIVGSVSLTAASDEANNYMISVARQASQEIADSLMEGADSRDIALARAFKRARTGHRGVLVMNRDSVMTDLPALSQLDGETQALIWDQIATRLGVGEEGIYKLAGTGISAIVANVGHASEPVMELRILPTDDSAETRDTNTVNRTSNARSPGPGPSAIAPPRNADDAVIAWWTEMGRYAKENPSQTVIIPAPIGSDAGYWVNTWSEATGRDARTEMQSRTRGEDRSKGGDSGPEVIAGSSAPAFPSLLQRRSAIAELARRVYSGPGTGPQFTADALSALLSWNWPGDLKELADLVAKLPPAVGDPWVIDVMDLPPHLASAPRRVLSRWEQAERDSLLQALVDAQGNKVQAAELLGIGRSTLYRKLRSLSIDQLQIDALRSDFSGEFSGPHAQRGARSASGPAHR